MGSKLCRNAHEDLVRDEGLRRNVVEHEHQELLAEQRNADANSTDKDGNTTLMKSVGNGHIEVVRYLAGLPSTDVNAKSTSGDTALAVADQNGHIEIVRYLAEQHDADVNIADDEGCTALMKAVTNEHIDIVQYLIYQGNVNVNVINNRGETAFQLAYNRGYQDIQRILTPFLSSIPVQMYTDDATENAISSSEKFCRLIPPSEIALVSLC